MQKRSLWQYIVFALVTAVVISGAPAAVFAETSRSSNYQTTETQFGVGSAYESCSASYCAKASIGDMTSGGVSKAPTSTATFGPITDADPLLEVVVDTGDANLGELTTERTATKTMTVRVRNYLSSGYMLQIVGTPPKYSGHTLKTNATPTASAPGTEQFGINLAANTTPQVGAGVVQVPSGEFSFGQADDGYSTPNLFKYHSGDVVARSSSESGQTDYTVSMIINVANSTPAGHYAGDFSAVVIPVF